MKMDLKTVRLTEIILFAAFWVMLVIWGLTKISLFIIVYGIIVALFCIVHCVFWRCPECGKYLGTNLWIKHCPHCGERIDLS